MSSSAVEQTPEEKSSEDDTKLYNKDDALDNKQQNGISFEILFKEVVSSPQLCIVSDVDGTLVEFAAYPDLAFPSEATKQMLQDLNNLPGVTFHVMSGRPKATMIEWFKDYPEIDLIAEHGAWVRKHSIWKLGIDEDVKLLDKLEKALRELARSYEGCLVERKTFGLALHLRMVFENREHLINDAHKAISTFLEQHLHYELLDGKQLIEIKLKAATKGQTIPTLRHAQPNCRMLMLGDDLTDEDMFREAVPGDIALIVGDVDRPTLANFNLPKISDIIELLRWILQIRSGASVPLQVQDVRPIQNADLLIISNRLPCVTEFSRMQNVGGLVSALQSVFATTNAVWLGWSGKLSDKRDLTITGSTSCLASFDMPEHLKVSFYDVACNGLLWPLLHSMHERMVGNGGFQTYVNANLTFSKMAIRLVSRRSPVWVHDYHLMLTASQLRSLGHVGPIGFFLHVPWPSPDLLFILSWAEELLLALLSFSLIGFHIQSYCDNFLQCVSQLKNVIVEDNSVYYNNHKCLVGVFPIGINPEVFEYPHSVPPPDLVNLFTAIDGRKLVLGVERLDYTKGILNRLHCMHRLFDKYPQWRRNLNFVQVCVPSRTDVEEYGKLRGEVEALAGNINGEFSDLDWIPLRLIMHGFPPTTLASLYEGADVMLVTPNRDGMNLVAMEYVAAQNPENPGVLLLSRFAGISTLFSDAVLTNPYDLEGMTRDLDRALCLGLAERQKMHVALLKVVKFRTAKHWADTFLETLTSTESKESPPTVPKQLDSQETITLSNVHHAIVKMWGKLTMSLKDLQNDPKAAKSIIYVPETDDYQRVKAEVTSRTSADVRPFSLARLAHPQFTHGALYVPHPYCVPSAKCQETYEFDSFFIILGLLRDGMQDLARGIVDNFCYEVEHYGMLLNRNHTEAAHRSHPPLLSQMALAVFVHTKDRQWLQSVLKSLLKCYRKWTSIPHLVPEIGLSRYCADLDPAALQSLSGQRERVTYFDRVRRHLKQHDVDCDLQQSYLRNKNTLTPSYYKADDSMRESGFDASHVFGPFGCETSSYVPVCLNSLLYQLEIDLGNIHELLELQSIENWAALAKQRMALVDKFLWDPEAGLYFNYNFVTQCRRHYPFASTFYPLWAGLASCEQANFVRENLDLFEATGGLLTSSTVTGCKWDAPFGCAPLQYFAVMGLCRYRYETDARRLAQKFVNAVARGFEKHGMLFDVYNLRYGIAEVVEDLHFTTHGQENGFGWTNGVVREFSAKFHLLEPHRMRQRSQDQLI